MKIIKRTEQENVTIPVAALDIAKMKGKEKLELHLSDSVVLLLPAKMTAWELLMAVDSLNKTLDMLTEELFQACGDCEACEAPCTALVKQRNIQVPKEMLAAAKIPVNARLCATPQPEEECIRIECDESQHSVADLTPELRDTLVQSGLCMGALEDYLNEGGIVYGE